MTPSVERTVKVSANEKYVVCLYFQDRLTGDFHTVYPQGMREYKVMDLLDAPWEQFEPVPPPPPPYP